MRLHVLRVPVHVPPWYSGLLHIKPTGDSKLSLNVIEGNGLVKSPGCNSASGSGSSTLLASAVKES